MNDVDSLGPVVVKLYYRVTLIETTFYAPS